MINTFLAPAPDYIVPPLIPAIIILPSLVSDVWSSVMNAIVLMLVTLGSRASNDPSRRLLKVLQSRRRPLLGPSNG